jgi:hypothetical protein
MKEDREGNSLSTRAQLQNTDYLNDIRAKARLLSTKIDETPILKKKQM